MASRPGDLVDVHVRCGPSRVGLPGLTPADYLQLADAAGVSRAAVSPSYRPGGYAGANDQLRARRRAAAAG